MNIIKKECEPSSIIGEPEKITKWRNSFGFQINGQVEFITNCREVLEDHGKDIADFFKTEYDVIKVHPSERYKYPKYSGTDLLSLIKKDFHDFHLRDLIAINLKDNIKAYSTCYSEEYDGMHCIHVNYSLCSYLNTDFNLFNFKDKYFELLMAELGDSNLICRMFPQLSKETDENGYCYWRLTSRFSKLPEATNYKRRIKC